MVETVSLRPNHYELLGITPAANSAEIAQAFAKELSLLPMRPFGSLAQVSLAYETLRDPIKRVARAQAGAEPSADRPAGERTVRGRGVAQTDSAAIFSVIAARCATAETSRRTSNRAVC